MDDKWDKFWSSGMVDDYLNFKNAAKDLNEKEAADVWLPGAVPLPGGSGIVEPLRMSAGPDPEKSC